MGETRTDGQRTLERVEERVPDVIDDAERLKSAVTDGTDDGRVLDLVEEIWDVVEEIEDVLATVDMRELPDAIDSERLLEGIDVEMLSRKLAAGDSIEATDLIGLRDSIELRELWEAVDLHRLFKELRELKREVADLTGDEDERSEVGEENESSLLEMDSPVDDIQGTIESLVEETAEAVRPAIFDAHDALRTLYELNQQTFGNGSRTSQNPTAFSTLPRGPVPTSVSTRVSTVPRRVRYSRVNNPQRIYGRRFESANTE
jgi:hypothetical protein